MEDGRNLAAPPPPPADVPLGAPLLPAARGALVVAGAEEEVGGDAAVLDGDAAAAAVAVDPSLCLWHSFSAMTSCANTFQTNSSSA